MSTEELKLKLWAMTGIMMTLQTNNYDLGLSQEDIFTMLQITLETYKGTDRVEQLVEARLMLDELHKEITGG